MKKIITLTSFFFAIWCLPNLMFAASFSLAPTTNAYRVGDTFVVGVYAEGIDRAVNAASGVLSFPTSKLEVVSISKAGSLLTLWVREPSFSNTGGTVTFEGIVPNPGFSGVSGRLLTVTFKAKATGTSVLSFSSGSLLANDGRGTNILNKFGTAQVTLSPVLPVKSGTQTPKSSVPATENITPKISVPKTWSQTFDTQLASVSDTSDKNVTASVPQSGFLHVANQTINILSVLVQIAALLFALLYLTTHGWHTVVRHHKGLRKRVCGMDIEK